MNFRIKIPNEYKNLNSKDLKIIALLDDSETIKPIEENQQVTDEYINEHWRELIMMSSTDPLQNDDKILQEEYGAHLNVKYS